jgi:outer membrane protein OmpA-like peptidoglycan-associated protein
MRIGIITPQGWTGEYDGWEPERAWSRTVAVARQAEGLGFESVWLFDHFHTVPRPTDEITFESFTTLSALAALTQRVRLGQIVICNGFRNPALTAKMASTLDTISGGRFELDGLTYETNSSTLAENGRATVARLATMLAKHPDAKISIEGHTDNTGTSAINQELSISRARSVKSALISHGIDAARLETAGHGPDTPIAGNDTDEGRAKNRRTEVLVKNK